MKFNRKMLFGLVAALAITGAAVAQIVTAPLVSTINATDAFQDIVNGQVSSTNYYASALQLRAWMLGQNSAQNAVPVLTTSTTVCGGSTATVKGTGVSGQIAEGSSASTSCVVTFPVAYVTAPECFVSIDNVTDSSLKCATSTTAMTITKSSAASEKINYLALGLPGG